MDAKPARFITAAMRVQQLVRKHKSLQGVADQTGVSFSTLWRVVNVQDYEPNTATLRSLGLKPGARYQICG